MFRWILNVSIPISPWLAPWIIALYLRRWPHRVPDNEPVRQLTWRGDMGDNANED